MHMHMLARAIAALLPPTQSTDVADYDLNVDPLAPLDT